MVFFGEASWVLSHSLLSPNLSFSLNHSLRKQFARPHAAYTNTREWSMSRLPVWFAVTQLVNSRNPAGCYDPEPRLQPALWQQQSAHVPLCMQCAATRDRQWPQKGGSKHRLTFSAADPGSVHFTSHARAEGQPNPN